MIANTIQSSYEAAALQGDVSLLRSLLAMDPLLLHRPPPPPRSSSAPLHVACKLGHTDFVSELLLHNTNLMEELDPNDNSSLLHLAARNGHLQLVKSLLALNPSLCVARDIHGRTPLHVAAIKGQIHVLEEFLKAKPGSGRERVGLSLDTLMHLCVEYNHLEMLMMAVRMIGDAETLNAANADGDTVLHVAVANKRLEVTMMKKRKTAGRERQMSEFLVPRGSAYGSSSHASRQPEVSIPECRPPLPTPPPHPSIVSAPPLVVTRGLSKDLPGWNSGSKINVLFDDLYQPVGEMAGKLKTQLGIIVRDGQRIPLTCVDWPAVDEQAKEGIWLEVQRNLLNAPIEYKQVCLQNCNNIWRDFKSKVKAKFFEKHKNNPNIHNMVPKNIVPEQWPVLVDYWRSPEACAISKRNSMNRELQGPSCNIGRTSYASTRYEMRNKGEPTDKMSVWLKVRDPNDHDVISIRMEYQALLDKEPEDQQQLTAVKDRIFHELLGKDGHGYCRTFGASVPRTFVYPHDPSTHTRASEMEQNITEDVSKKLTDQFNQKYDELIEEATKKLTAQFDQKYDALVKEVTTKLTDLFTQKYGELLRINPELQAPADDICDYSMESIGDGATFSRSGKEPPRIDEHE